MLAITSYTSGKEYIGLSAVSLSALLCLHIKAGNVKKVSKFITYFTDKKKCTDVINTTNNNVKPMMLALTTNVSSGKMSEYKSIIQMLFMAGAKVPKMKDYDSVDLDVRIRYDHLVGISTPLIY